MYSGINEALQAVERRARPRLRGELPHVPNEALLPSLASANSQVIIGREGTGKTHLLLGLEKELEASGYLCAFVDLQIAGSATDLYGVSPDSSDLHIRATRLAADALAAIHDALRINLLDQEALDPDSATHLDALAEAITRVRVAGEEERSQQRDNQRSQKANRGGSIDLSPGSLLGASLSQSKEVGESETSSTLIVQRGHADVWLHLGSVRQAFEGLARERSGLVILLDEWDSVPPRLQPWLADLVRRLLWDTPGCVVKIAAAKPPFFEKALLEGMVGLKSSRGATIDLDGDNPPATDDFLLRVLHEHVSHEISRVASPEDPFADVRGFTDAAFASEGAARILVEAAERNPRDALTIADRAAQMAGLGPLKQADIVEAAHWLTISHKLVDLDPTPGLARWITERVLAPARSRTFFVPLAAGEMPPALVEMYDRRLLHQDEQTVMGLSLNPQEMFAEWHVDFGYALQLLRTVDSTLSDIEVPPIGAYDHPGEAPRFDIKEIEKLATESFAPPVSMARIGTGNAWVDRAIEALPSSGDYLVVESGGTVATVQLTESPSVLGRSTVHATINIEDETVSRRHAELVKVGGGHWRLLDCDSSNGVTLNGKSIAAADLRSHDVIGLGTARLFFIRRLPV